MIGKAGYLCLLAAFLPFRLDWLIELLPSCLDRNHQAIESTDGELAHLLDNRQMKKKKKFKKIKKNLKEKKKKK